MNEILTIREVRTAREKLCEEIAHLVSDFEKRAKGVRISGINITRAAKKDRRGIGYYGLSVTVVATVKDGDGSGEI